MLLSLQTCFGKCKFKGESQHPYTITSITMTPKKIIASTFDPQMLK
jgi:hypothetical protein